MEKYAVFTESKFVPTHELSLSNKIIEREDILTVLSIVRDWVHSIDKDCLVYFRGDVKNATVMSFTVTKPNQIGGDVGLTVYCKESNVRFRLGVFKTNYVTKKVGNG